MDFSKDSKGPKMCAVIPGRNEITCMKYTSCGKRLLVVSSVDSRMQVIDCASNGKAEQPPLKVETERIVTIAPT